MLNSFSLLSELHRGFAKGEREYALQTSHNGFFIIDITDPTSVFEVQFIAMAGGNGWRDVDIYESSTDGKTYGTSKPTFI